jgi:hypothetical protein
MYMFYSVLIYIFYHPFLALKVTFVTHSVAYIISMMRCLFQGMRPVWLIKSNLSICPITYGHPSLHYFLCSFFWLYLVISIGLQKKKKTSFIVKLSVFMAIFFVFSSYGLLRIMNKLNYFYQINFAFTISLVLIVLCINIESFIHNGLLNSLQNVYITRKKKIQFFLIIMTINIFSIMLVNVISDDYKLELQRKNSKIVKKNHIGRL